MQKLLTGLAAAAALSLTMSAALACDLHESVSAQSSQPQQGVAMSTHGSSPAPIVLDEDSASVDVSVVTVCEPGASDCVAPSSE
jgi:hypothetical protein